MHYRSIACRAFQRGECEAAAGECEFVHIMPPVSRADKPCFDFLRGQCTYGDRCRWSHSPEALRVRQRSPGVPTYDAKAQPTRVEHVAYPYQPPALPAQPLLTPPPVNFDLGTLGQDGVPSAPPSSPNTPSSDLASFVFCDDSLKDSPTSLLPSPPASDGSSSDNESIDTYLSPSACQYLEVAWPMSSPVHHNVQHQPLAMPIETYGCSPFSAWVTTPQYQDNPYPRSPTSLTGANSPQKRRRSIRGGAWIKKAQAYGTKPCKFFAENGQCPRGDMCTFAHGAPTQSYQPSTKLSRQRSPPLDLPRTRSIRSSSISTSTSTYSTSSIEPESATLRSQESIEEMRSRGFYPISWRVIGGGVKMSGSQPPCRGAACKLGPDCPYIHATDPEADDDAYCFDSAPVVEPSELPTARLAATAVPAALLPVHPLRTLDVAINNGLPVRPRSTPPVLMRSYPTASLVAQGTKIGAVESPPGL